MKGRCPKHVERVGKEDRNPSWYINRTTGAHQCWSCGYRGNLFTLIADVSGETDGDLITEVYKSSTKLNLDKAKSKLEPVEEDEPEDNTPVVVVSEYAYAQFGKVPRRMLELRGLSRPAVDAFGVRWNKEGRVWIIPVRNPHGFLLGWQERAKGFFLNVPDAVPKSECLFGLHLYQRGSLVLVESPLDAVRLHTVGVAAVSSYGAWVSDTQIELLRGAIVGGRLVCGLDNDPPGMEAAHSLMKRYGEPMAFLNYAYTTAKDPGDATDDEIVRMFESRTALAPAMKKAKR